MVHQVFWRLLLSQWNVSPVVADCMFEDLRERYSGPERFYHTLDHAVGVVSTVDSLQAHAMHVNAVKLAAWLHDVIYDSRAADNEERSAEYAERLCQELAISEGRIVGDLIRVTKRHEAGDDADTRVLLDADLAVLGASDQVYHEYAQNIRREYAWVPDAEYRAGRRRVLEHFLSRPRIYYFLVHLEGPARRNLAAEIDRLA